jgi:two-component system LytT family sensor kinase
LKLKTTYSLKKILLLFPIWWLFWAIMQIFVLHRLGISWNIALVDGVISNALLSILVLSFVIFYRYYQPGTSNRILRLFHGLAVTIIYSILLNWIFQFLFSTNSEYLSFVEKSMPIRSMYAFLMMAFISVLSWVLSQIEEKQVQDLRKAETDQIAIEVELVRLRQQLQPHFLFNSLNSISALAGSRPNEAREMIQKLSDFLRGTLKKDEQKKVTLKEELEHLNLYLDIEKVRFGYRLQTKLNIDENTLSIKLPPMLIQPIVENAIKFGLYDTIDSITINIDATIENELLCITVKNPFDSETVKANEGLGFGLTSIQRRLQLLYARNDLMLTEKKENVFTTTLKIPQQLL